MNLWKRELKNLSHSLSGWLYFGIFLFVSGISFAINNWYAGTSDFTYLYRAILIYSFFAIPAFTAFSVCEDATAERKTFFASLPIPSGSAFWAKFAALGTWMLLPTVCLLIYPALLKGYGTVSWGKILLMLLGMLLLQISVLAFSVFVCSKQLKKWLAYFICFGVLAVLYVFPLIADFCASSPWILFVVCILVCLLLLGIFHRRKLLTPKSGIVLGSVALLLILLAFLVPRFYDSFLPNLLCILSLASQYNEFCNGFLSIAGILYFICFSTVFLLLAKESFTSLTKPKKEIALALALVLLLINIGFSFLPLAIKAPGKMSETFTLTEDGIASCKALTKEVTLYFICDGGERNADPDLLRFALQFASYSDKIQVTVIDSITDKAFLNDVADVTPSGNDILLVCGQEKQFISSQNLYYYINLYFQMAFTPSEYNYYLQYFSEAGTDGEMYLQYLQTYSYPLFSGEEVILSAIKTVSGENIKEDSTSLPYASDKLFESNALSTSPSGWFIPLFWALILPIALSAFGLYNHFSRKKK